MDCPDANVPGSGSTHGSNDDVHVPRVKFLCSFLGSILPRPQDGKLRYVGGETRIVCLPRDVTYEESMSRMRELYEGAVVLKYQQPDEDLDALVSVVNDADVTNMMEEYDKLGSGDGFTRLRIFLFSHPDQVGSNHYIDGDDWEWDRRYVDAQNSLNDGNDSRKLQYPDSPVISSIDDVHMAEWFFNTMNLESGIHNQPQYNVHDLIVPHMSSGQHQQPVSERYNEREGPWSPAYYSPRHYAHHDPPRPLPEFPSSPPSSRIRMPFAEERIPKEHARQHLNHHPTYKPHPQVSENFVRMPPGTVSGDRTGFPGNLFHGHNVLDGNNTCENCQLTFHRNQLHLDQPNMGNGLPQVPISCAECRPNRENLVLNAEAKLSHCMYSKDNDSLSVYNESHRLERGWVLQHQLNPRLEEARTHMSGAGRVNDHYLVDGPGMNIPPGHSNLVYSTIGCGPGLINNNVAEAVRTDENHNLVQEKEANHVEKFGNTDVKTSFPEHKMIAEKSIGSTSLQTTAVSGDIEKPRENGPSAPPEDTNLSAHSLSFLPELIASVKSAVLEGAEDVKAKVEDDYFKPNTMPKEAPVNESELVNIHGESEVDSDIDYVKMSTIEPTMAEAEAIARGLQTIKNDDLEEIRELGSGTYGSVYYGKWRGSDVAIKRIKASCFAGRPSERERLIADFWKEASLLSSLHHPNVVSFYGIVRDGPDGSLATVTEFMVNGSLKQFLRKKDRTIDRRKRLILAMDAAFGMEYLHGKNIVHFDLKCENLLVNMRDPQRPVCKIGDLGLSKVKQQTLVSGGVRGTLPWMAPELLSGKSHMVTEKIDVYSFGIVMWELLTGDEPYAEMHCASIIGGIVNNTLRPQIPTWCDPEWKSLMESCWASDPAERPSFSEISQRLRSMAAAINVK